MAELNSYSSGAVNISEDVIGLIGSIAASEVKGVRELQGSLAEEMFELVGGKSGSKGVEVEFDESGIRVKIDVVIDFWADIRAVAREVQASVKSAIEDMTAKQVQSVDVNIVAINFKQD